MDRRFTRRGTAGNGPDPTLTVYDARMRTLPFVLVLTAVIAGLVRGQAPASTQPAAPPRGASGPPEHAKVAPINNLPNPYETVRNWGTLPDGRKSGSVSAVHVNYVPRLNK